MLDGRTQVVPQSRTRRMIERRPEWTEHDEQSASGSPNEGGQGRQFQLSCAVRRRLLQRSSAGAKRE